jgi:hypothetical protein
MERMELEIAVDAGLSIGQLAQRFGCSKGSVRYWLGKYGLQTQSGSTHRAAPDVVAAREAQLVVEAGGCCQLCGYDRCPGALRFHRVDRDAEALRAGPYQVGMPIDRRHHELHSSVVLCRNCHAEVEGGFTTLPIHYDDRSGLR